MIYRITAFKDVEISEDLPLEEKQRVCASHIEGLRERDFTVFAMDQNEHNEHVGVKNE